jgi:hypothetical protein
MANDTSTTHITPEELADYFAARLPEAREGEIEMHLGGCDACTDEARQFRAFSAIWDDWILQAPEEAWEQVALAHALQQAQGQVDNPQWAERFRHWHTTWAGKAQAAARLVLEAADRTAQLITEGLEVLSTPGQTWDFALGAAPVRVRGRRVRGQTPGPLTPQARLQVHEIAPGVRDVQLRVEALPSHQPPPLVLLIPIDTDTPPLVAGLMPTPDGTSFVARFREVPSGEYLLAVEPMRDVGP